MSMFIDREKELEFLKNVKRPGLIFIYGRRRIGKSALIDRLIELEGGVRFQCVEGSVAVNLRRFARDLEKYMGITANFSTLTDFFDFLAKLSRKRLVIAIDEYPYLKSAVPEVSSIFQAYWDNEFSKGKALFIICGSHQRMMKKELNYPEPLFGRRSGQIEVKKLELSDALLFFPHKVFEEKLFIYSACDGIPAYLLEFRSSRFEKKVLETFFNEYHAFFHEPMLILKSELTEVNRYFAVLSSLSRGPRKFSDISSEAGIEGNKLSKYLQTLTELGYVGKETPLFGGRPLWKLTDYFMRFWFYFVFPFYPELDFKEAEKRFRKNFDMYFSRVFEEIARKAIVRVFRGYAVGRQWGKHKDYGPYEIDIAALSPDKKELVLAEVKWADRKIGKKELEELREKASLLGFEGKIKYLLIGKKVAKIDEPDAEAWDLRKLEQIFTQK